MERSFFEQVKRYFGFSERDAANVRSLAGHALPMVAGVVDRFYSELVSQEGASAIFTGGEQQLARLRGTLSVWMTELFEGPYDEAYYGKRLRVGETHVRVGLEQHYMFTGAELVWRELEKRLCRVDVPDLPDKLRSLHKLLMLDLAIMMESYKKSYSQQVREFERSAVEEKLTRAEHLAEIGQLAASLAHEIKNPLAGISGAIQIIRDGMGEADPHRPIVQEILGQIGRLDATVKDLLHYARPTPPRASNVALDQVVQRVLTVLRTEPALQRVRIVYDRPPADTAAFADEAQIEQLVINLLINAAHASKDGGVIHLGIERNTRHVRLVVRDEGRGMTADVRDRAFEPFFTTKAKGTGLGLSICKRIVEANGGRIELQSEVGRGTTVAVNLPYKSFEMEQKTSP